MNTSHVGRQLSDVVSTRVAARLRAFRREAERALPGKISEVILFGSRARGEAQTQSDYDLAVFVTDLDHRREISHTLADTAHRHILPTISILD